MFFFCWLYNYQRLLFISTLPSYAHTDIPKHLSTNKHCPTHIHTHPTHPSPHPPPPTHYPTNNHTPHPHTNVKSASLAMLFLIKIMYHGYLAKPPWYVYPNYPSPIPSTQKHIDIKYTSKVTFPWSHTSYHASNCYKQYSLQNSGNTYLMLLAYLGIQDINVKCINHTRMCKAGNVVKFSIKITVN